MSDDAETPELVLARTLEKAKAGYIKSVVIGIVWDDDSVAADWSFGKLGQMLLALRVAETSLDDTIREMRDPDWHLGDKDNAS